MANTFTYAPPGITVIANGPATLLTSGVPQKVLMLVGTAPFGPDYPVLMSPSQAMTAFGDPSLPVSIGHTLPLGMFFANQQRQPVSNSAIRFLVCRVGVTRATIAVPDQTPTTPLTAFNVKGIGAFAGSAGNKLTVVIAVTGSVVTSITVNDTTSGSPVVKQVYFATQYDLTSNQKIAAAINGANPLTNPNSIIQVDTVSATALLPAAGTLALAAGTDGLGTASNHASIAAALANSLYVNADYIWAGWDASAIAPTLLSHINTAVSQNNFRKAILGPALGTTFSALSGGTYIGANGSQRMVFVGHDAAYAVNQITRQLTMFDGIYLAAAYAGLKAVGPTQETCTTFSIAGFSTLGVPQDLTSPLTQAQLNTLAGNGFLVFEQRPNGALVIRDGLSTAPLYLNNTLNPFSQFNVQDIDDAVSQALVQAVLPFKGRPSASLAIQINQLQNACAAAMGILGDTINGVNSIVVTVDPNSGIPTVNVSYITRYPNNQINVTTNYTFL